MSALSDLLNENIPEGVSSRELERQCENAISRQTIDNYRAGKHGTPSEDVLRVFHEMLSIPIGRLRAAANQPEGEPGRWTPPQEAHRMNRRQRRAVTELIRSFVTQPLEVDNVVPSSQAAQQDAQTQGRQAQKNSNGAQGTPMRKPRRGKPGATEYRAEQG